MRIKIGSLFVFLLLGLIVMAQSTKVRRGPRQTVNIDSVPASSFYAGQLYIKFKPGFDNFLKKEIGKNGKGKPAFGIPALDKVMDHQNLMALKRSFEPILANNIQANKHQDWDLHRWYTLEIPKQANVKDAIRQLKALNGIIEIAEPNYIRTLYNGNDPVQLWTPGDSAYNLQWHYNHTQQQGSTNPPGIDADIDLPEAWELETGKPNVIVAVLDGGVDTSHPDLRPNLWVGSGGEHFGYNWNNNTPLIQRDNHGTHVNGTIAAVNNNSIGVAGIAGGNGLAGSGARLMSMQIFGSGIYAGDAGVANAYVYSADRGASIAQNSWGGGSFSSIITDAIDYFIMNGGGTVLNGGIVFFSAGNDGSEKQNFPGTYPPVVCVTATNYNDKKSWYSSYGNWVDISAPGGETNAYSGGPVLNGGKKGILSTLPISTGVNYGWIQGTSMACPHVSGVAALCVSKSPGLMSNEQLRNILLNSVDDISALNPDYSGKMGSGRLNAFLAVQNAAMATGTLVDSARNFTASQSCGQATLSWTKNASNNNVMIAASDSLLFGWPSGIYNVGDMLPGGGKVIYTGNGTSFNPSLPVNQRKYFRIWSYVGSNYSFSRSASSIYKLVASEPNLVNAEGCQINISWNDALGCITDSVMLLAHNRDNYGTPSGILSVGDTVPGGAKVIYKGRGSSFLYNSNLDSTIYIQKWNFNASNQYSNPDPSFYYSINKLNSIATLIASSPGSSQMDISWQNNTDYNCFGSDSFMLAFNTSSSFGNPKGTYTVGAEMVGGGTVLYIGTNTNFSHTGLLENANYCYRVWKIRNGTEYSSGKGVCSRTQCAIRTLALPYASGFNGEDISDPDICEWEVTDNTSVATALKIVPLGTHPDVTPIEGSGMLRFNAYNISTNQTARITSKAIKKGIGNSMDIRFKWYQDSSNYTSSSYDGEGVFVQWSTASNNWKNLEFYPRVPKQILEGWSYKQLTLPDSAINQDTVYVSFLFISKFGNNSYLDDVHFKISSYKPSDGITRQAACESTDSSSMWTHYFDSEGDRLLSVKKKNINIGKAGEPAFQLKISGNSNASNIPISGTNYVSNTGGWLAMNRYYFIKPVTEPNDTIGIRFYYGNNDFNALASLATSLTPSRNTVNHTDMFGYKINDIEAPYNPDPVAGHSNIPLATGFSKNGFVQYFNASKPDTAGWKYGNTGMGFHYMEYQVAHLGSGGLGIGSTNGYGALQLSTYTFTGNGNWNIASNWSNNLIPPPVLPSNAQIIINPSGAGECILNILQKILPGAFVKVISGKKFSITGSLEMKQ